jgi:class 3 adenylate cyclase/tetratricopeptide (TPR) repeat protein
MGIVTTTVEVSLLGPFRVSHGGREAGPWPRPSARRLCQLVLTRPGRRVSRDLVCEELFADLDPRAAARAVSKALSMTRAALAVLGDPAPVLLEADLTHIWAAASVTVDADIHEAALRAALAMSPGQERDDRLVAALADDGELLADEPYADWAMEPRDRLETLRQNARLTLARDRSRGAGRARQDAVTAAWESCFEHDPACEEAAIALIRASSRESAALVFERCAAALDELGLKPSASLEEAFAATASRVAAEAPPAELRTVTILSADVPAQSADPETLRELVANSLAVVTTEVESLGGSVTSVSGSGLLAVFGAPTAHEDDQERAIRAASRALTASAQPVRIGVETGTVVLGPIGRVEYAPVGDVVTTAATLQSLAGGGEALVGPVTRAAAGHLFTWTGSEDAPGGITATYLGKPRPGARGRPSGLGGSGPLVGRADALAALDAALRDATAGRGCVVVVTGEPGLGKTRLVEEFHKRVAAAQGRPPLWLEGRCASYASSTPYSLYQQLLGYLGGVTPDLPESVVRPALERLLSRIEGAGDLFPPLARMMGLPAGAAMGRQTPEEIHNATFAAWQSLMTQLVATSQAILVLEDLHWADPTSRHLTERLAALTAHRKFLIIITTRPDPEAAAALPVDGTRGIELGPLTGDAERALARSLIGTGVTQDILDTVLNSVDGNPLFLEERLSSLLETKTLVKEHGTWRLNEAARLEVPQALERLVRSRVDRLSPAARDVVRHASVLGFEFRLGLLAAVCAVDPLAPVLEELRAADIVHDVDGLPKAAFRFRHALIQEALYSGLPRAERQRLHGRAAWALEAAHTDRLEKVAAVLGRHFTAAGEPDRAVTYLDMAGDRATSVFANDEAIASYRSAMAIVDADPASTNAAVELRAKLANVLWRIGRWVEARQAFEEALALPDNGNVLRSAHLWIRLGRLEMADRRYDESEAAFDAAGALLGDDPASMDAAAAEEWLELMVDGRSALYGMLDQPERVLAVLDSARPMVETRGSSARKFGYYGHLAFGRVLLHRFRIDEADVADMRTALDAAWHTGEEKDAGYAISFLAWILFLRGDLDEAQDLFEQGLKMAERIGETLLTGDCVLGLARIAVRRHDTDAVREFATRALAGGWDTGTGRHNLAEAKACLVWLAWREGRPADVLTLADEISDTANAHRWVYLWPLLAIHLDAGRPADAVAAGRALIHPEQQRLPDELESALESALAAWDSGQPSLAAQRLAGAVALAQDLRYA